jgi:cobalamin-dependent methionine synthase I
LVYIRSKKVKGIEYAYLVRSIWDQTNRTSKQETVKYLGKVTSITEQMIPIEYRSNPSVISFITRYGLVNSKHNDSLTKKLGQKLFEMLTAGDLNGVIKIFDKYSNLFAITQFFDNLLKPIMYDIGKLWEEEKLDIATEHVSVNTANALIKIINKRYLKSDTKKYNKAKIFICTPNGEQHNLACNILESILLSKGYRVFNASPSLPADSIIDSLNRVLPDAILISVTLDDNIQTAKNLIRKIRTRFPSLPIFVGGLAINETVRPFNFDTINTIVIRNIGLMDAVREIRSNVAPKSPTTRTVVH